MKVYTLAALVLTLMAFVSPSKGARSPYYQPTLQEVLTNIEYRSIYPSGTRDHRNVKQLKQAQKKLKDLLERTNDSFKRKGIERELTEIGHFIGERRYD